MLAPGFGGTLKYFWPEPPKPSRGGAAAPEQATTKTPQVNPMLRRGAMDTHYTPSPGSNLGPRA